MDPQPLVESPGETPSGEQPPWSPTGHQARSRTRSQRSYEQRDVMDAGEAGAMFETNPEDLPQLSDRRRSFSMDRSEKSYQVNRPVYTQQEFDEEHGGHSTRRSFSQKICDTVTTKRNKARCDRYCVKDFFFTYLPVLNIMGHYKVRSWLLNDIISGITVGVMHIPQGMAYAMLATLPPVQGLYTSFFPTLVYFIFGTSRHISMGTIAIVSLLTGSLMERQVTPVTARAWLDANNGSVPFVLPGNSSDPLVSAMTAQKMALAAAMCLAVGLVQLMMGVLRLGFLTRYLSDPMISGFTTGASVHVFTSQVKYALGVDIPRHSGAFTIPKTYYEIFKRIHTANVPTVCISLIAIVILVIFKEFINPRVRKRFKAPIPIELFIVVSGTLSSYFLDLNGKHGVKIVGDIPGGIPPPRAPNISLVGPVIGDAITTAIIAFSVCVSLAKIFAKKHGYEVDATQELIAYGLTNCFSSFFYCYPAASSLSRSSVQESMGGETQLAGILSSCLLFLVLLFIGPYFKTVPNCCLSAIILVALKGMFLQAKEVPKLWRFSQYDFWTWILSCAATVILDVDYGLLVGIGFSIFSIILRTQAPTAHLLGSIPNTDLYKNIYAYDDAQEVPGIKIYRYEGSLYYACAEHFRESIYSMTDFNPRKEAIRRKRRRQERESAARSASNGAAEVEVALQPRCEEAACDLEPHEEDLHHVIVDCSTWSYIDYVGVKVMSQIIQEYRDIGVHVFLANPKTGIREMFNRCDFYEKVNQNIIYVSVHDAVQAALYEQRLRNKLKTVATASGNDLAATVGSDPSV